VFIGYFTTVFNFIDIVMHLCSWSHCNRRTINSFMMMMMISQSSEVGEQHLRQTMSSRTLVSDLPATLDGWSHVMAACKWPLVSMSDIHINPQSQTSAFESSRLDTYKHITYRCRFSHRFHHPSLRTPAHHQKPAPPRTIPTTDRSGSVHRSAFTDAGQFFGFPLR